MVTHGNSENRYSVTSSLRGIEEGIDEPECGGVHGTTNLITAAPLSATATIGAPTSTIMSVFGLCGGSGGLFIARVFRWESVERVSEESSLFPRCW